LGVESGSDVTLRGLGKNYGKEAVLKAGKLLREAGIPATWYLLLGAPGETPATLAETFATVNQAASPWDLVNIAVGLRVYQGAPLAEELRRNGAPAVDDFLRPQGLRRSYGRKMAFLKYFLRFLSFSVRSVPPW
jgi:radical SAM superfamily enzyme YgiQ (UPF0313 family)